MLPVYLCILENGSIMLFERIPRVIFVSKKRKKILENFDLLPLAENVQIFEDIVFKNFQITKELLQKLKQLETIEEMRDILKRELAFGMV